MALGVVIVGAGLMGGWHARYAQKAGARVLGVVDADERRSAALAARLGGVRSLAAAEPWLEELAPDVVHVCTPLASHHALAERALGAGCSVLVEKPIAPALAGTRELLRLAERAGKALAPVHQFPFQAGFRAVRARLAELGPLKRIEVRICSAGADAGEAGASGDFLLDVLPHAVSLFRALGHDVPAAAWDVVRFDARELFLAHVNGGTLLSVWISADVRPTVSELSLYGAAATAHVDLFHGFGFVDTAAVSRASKLARPFRWAGRQATSAARNLAERAVRGHAAYPGLPELIAEFHRSVERGGAPVVSAEEALASAELRERLSQENEKAS